MKPKFDGKDFPSEEELRRILQSPDIQALLKDIVRRILEKNK